MEILYLRLCRSHYRGEKHHLFNNYAEGINFEMSIVLVYAYVQKCVNLYVDSAQPLDYVTYFEKA